MSSDRRSGVTALEVATSPRQPLRVLVADADDAFLQATTERLVDADFHVSAARDGLTASRLLSEGGFDVVLCELDLEGIDGLSLLRLVKASAGDVPVVLMTSDPALETAVMAIEEGALRYLVKPVALDAVFEAVRHAGRIRRLGRLKQASLATIGEQELRPGDITNLDSGFSRAMDTLWIAYQPVVTRSEMRVFGFEALVRSDEPTLRMPVELLASAERLGRLHELGQRVRGLVTDTLNEAPDELVFFVNCHPYEIVDEQLLSPTSPLTAHAGRVVLEITERAACDEIPDLANRVARLRKLGFRIAIDDFGTGYAGLTSFTRLEPDVVKLDATLASNLETEPLKQRLIKSMVDVCTDMNMLVVAEGIQTAAVFDILCELGCGLYQGHLFAHPQPWDVASRAVMARRVSACPGV